MKKCVNKILSSSVSTVMIVQLAFPFQVVLAGNTVQGNLSDLKAGQVSMGEVPKNTPEYYKALCDGIDAVEDGSVKAKDSTGAMQDYKLSDACKSTNLGKLTNEMRINCTLFEATKTSQVKAYCDARTLAMKAKTGTDAAYKMDIAAAGTCWAEYLMIKAAQSSGIAAGVSKATNGKICGTASMAAGLVEVGTTASMLFQKKGKKVSSDGTVSGRDDLTLYGGMIASMGIGVLGVNYGRCLLNIGMKSIGDCDPSTERTKGSNSGSVKNLADKAKNFDFSKANGGHNDVPKTGDSSGSNSVVDRTPAANDVHTAPKTVPPAPVNNSGVQNSGGTGGNYDGKGGTKQNKWDYHPGDENGAYTPKSDPVISPIEVIFALSKENPEFREAVISTLQGDYYDQWKRESFKDSFARLSLDVPATLVAGGDSAKPVTVPVKKYVIPTQTVETTLPTIERKTGLNQMKVDSPEMQKHLQESMQRKQAEWDKIKNNSPAGVNKPTGDSSANNSENMDRFGRPTDENGNLIGKNGDATKTAKKGGSSENPNKEKLIMKAALAFTALAAMRYLTRNNAKKTQENAEHFLGSMINSAPTTGAPPTYTTGGGLRVGNGYVGGGPAPSNGDQSGITAGGPEDILAPRGSPQRGAFEKVASQIPNSVLDSPPGSAIGQIAGAMGSNGGLVAAHADDVAKSALAALGSSNDIYATESGGSGGHSGKSDGGGLNLNLGGLGGEQEQGGTEGEMAFRAPAMNCSEDIYHSQCKANMNMFQIVSDRYSRQPIAKDGQQAF